MIVDADIIKMQIHPNKSIAFYMYIHFEFIFYLYNSLLLKFLSPESSSTNLSNDFDLYRTLS